MPMRSRLENTPEIWARSLGRPVSFSTMLARISACSGVFKGVSGARWLQAASSFLSMARIARANTARSLLPLA